MITKLRNLTGAVVLVSLSSCASMAGSLLPAGLGDVLGNVTGLTSKVTEWSNSLGATLGGAEFAKLRGFVDSAGAMGDKVMGFKDKVAAAAADPLAAIGGKLSEMGNFDVSALQNLPGAAQLDQVRDFAASAGGLGAQVSDFMTQFGG